MYFRFFTFNMLLSSEYYGTYYFYVCTIPILPKSSNIHGMLFRWNAKHIWTAFWDTFQSAMLFRKQPSRFSKSHNGQHCVVNTVFTPLLDFQIDFLSVFWDWWLLNRCIVTFFGWAQVRYVLLYCLEKFVFWSSLTLLLWKISNLGTY